MTYLSQLQASLEKWADEPQASNACLLREELKQALAQISLLERCYSAPDAVK